MIKEVYAVYDLKVLNYSQPTFHINRGEAIRMFSDAVNDENTYLHRHPGDYELVLIGQYDDEVGAIIPCEKENLGLAASFVSHPEANKVLNKGE